MHGEEKRAEACNGAVEIIPLSLLPAFQMQLCAFHCPLLHLIILSRERGVASAGNMTDFTVGRCKQTSFRS